jgi:hypothetical protein
MAAILSSQMLSVCEEEIKPNLGVWEGLLI